MAAPELSLDREERPAVRPAPAGDYLPALDGLRAIAILFVLAGHLTHLPMIPGGFGVTLFFFISGLLITRLLLVELDRRGGVDLPRFYVRRLLRLAPALVGMVLIVAAVAALRGGEVKGAEVFSAIFYISNYYRIFIDYALPFAVLWSLSVEEHYYLAYPALLPWLMRSGRPLLILAVACGVALIWRAVLMSVIHPPANYTNMATDTRFDSILFGAMFSIWQARRPNLAQTSWLVSPWVVAGSLVTLLACFLVRTDFLRETVRYTLQGLAFIPLVAAVVFNQTWPLYRAARKVLGAAPLVFVGRLSYSLYLWHYPCIFAVKALAPGMGFVASVLVSLGLSVAAALLSYFALERSFLALRRRFGSHAV